MTPLTSKQKKELKDFKFRVGLEAYNAVQCEENKASRQTVIIDNMECIFYPYNRRQVDTHLRKFKTTKWW